jgi:hypothetical protein
MTTLYLSVRSCATNCLHSHSALYYSASHSRVAPENVGLQKYNTFACHTCNEVRLCVLGIRRKQDKNNQHEKRRLRNLQLKVECSVSMADFGYQTVQQTSSGNF